MPKKIGETEAIRIYDPYYHEKSGRIAWFVRLPGKKKKVFKSKLAMLHFIDEVTTNIKK